MSASEVDDVEQKKRGAGKTTSLNAIPTGAQKPEYTYSIYQSPGSQPSQSYQSQVPNSFYPHQTPSQYYTSANSQSEATPAYPQQPQLNLLPPSSSSQYLPFNFVQNPGFQPKIQLVPTKTSNGNIQLAILQQPSFAQQSVVPYPQLFSPHPSGQVNHQPYQQFNLPNYQPLSFGGPYVGQPSTMYLVTQPNPSLYNNLLYPNPGQSFYNYYPSNSQGKYNTIQYGSQQPNEYEKLQGPITQAVPKEDNDLSIHNTEYITPSDSNYKNSYTGRGTSYTKLT